VVRVLLKGEGGGSAQRGCLVAGGLTVLHEEREAAFAKAIQTPLRVAAQERNDDPDRMLLLGVSPAKRDFSRVGDAGFEPATSAV
jgi:hypothetical protein